MFALDWIIWGTSYLVSPVGDISSEKLPSLPPINPSYCCSPNSCDTNSISLMNQNQHWPQGSRLEGLNHQQTSPKKERDLLASPALRARSGLGNAGEKRESESGLHPVRDGKRTPGEKTIRLPRRKSNFQGSYLKTEMRRLPTFVEIVKNDHTIPTS